ncbi:MAG TPA: DUF6629 family protein [Chitinophagaceae bacterium]|nr:DUF6629 family protein [Chitinophagaceae bacterium]
MCFSAGASFGASAVLSIIGTAAIMKARTIPQGLFAGIPIIFSVQQLSEGMLWLSLKDPQYAAWQSFFTYAFLVFALMIWPVWIPFTIRKLERDTKRKKILGLFLFTGVLVSAAAGCAMLLYPAIVVHTDHHLHYSIGIPPATKEIVKLFTLFYLATTIITTFISSTKRMNRLGIGFLLSYSVTVIFYSGSIVSVWCYFAALLSMIVFWIVSGLQEPAYRVIKQ